MSATQQVSRFQLQDSNFGDWGYVEYLFLAIVHMSIMTRRGNTWLDQMEIFYIQN